MFLRFLYIVSLLGSILLYAYNCTLIGLCTHGLTAIWTVPIFLTVTNKAALTLQVQSFFFF